MLIDLPWSLPHSTPECPTDTVSGFTGGRLTAIKYEHATYQAVQTLLNSISNKLWGNGKQKVQSKPQHIGKIMQWMNREEAAILEVSYSMFTLQDRSSCVGYHFGLNHLGAKCARYRHTAKAQLRSLFPHLLLNIIFFHGQPEVHFMLCLILGYHGHDCIHLHEGQFKECQLEDARIKGF